LILRHVTSKKLKEIELNLNLAPMVVEELKLIPNVEKGPVIIYEGSGTPYIAHQFRRLWREVANAAGVPKSIRNMDSRAGAITEATMAGAALEDIRHAATHSDIATTQRYARDSAGKTAKVMQMRMDHRNKKGT
jgi:site-specific recombinase XerD